MNKLLYILNEINKIDNYNLHIKNAKEIKVKYYTLHKDSLNKVSDNIVLKHNFGSEVLKLGELLEKKLLINKIISTKKIKIERHSFAPEINKTYFNNKSISTPYVTEISKKITIQKQLKNHNYINLIQHLNKLCISNLNNILILN